MISHPETETFEHIPRISQPKELKIPLYQHQLVSIYDMEEKEKLQKAEYENIKIDTNIGVNADKTGYGKTLAMTTLVYRDKMEWDLSKPYLQKSIETFAGGRIKKTSSKEYEKLDVTLVLSSQSIINQWYEECKKTPLSVKMITTTKLVETTYVENYDIVLVTPSMYNKICMKYSHMAWKRFIFDEPGHVKVPGMRKLIAGFIWLVSATPDSIIAKHRNCRGSFIQELVCYTDDFFLSFSTYFWYMIVKNSDIFIDHSFSMPKTEHSYYKCYNPIFNAVSGLVTKSISEMISAGNIKGAIRSLGGGETTNIVALIKHKKEAEIEEVESRIKIMEIRNKKKSIKSLKDRISRINTQIKDLDSRFTKMLEGDCTICFNTISNPVMEPNCQNIFCGDCLLTWLKTKPSCPLCRDNLQPKQLVYINTGEDYKKTEKKCDDTKIQTKVNTIINLIKRKQEGKFIIFSAWDQTFSPIRNHLTKNDISFIEVKGCVEQRKKNIDNFKYGNTKVIFLNSRNNGAGINLQESTDIIVYHEMSEDSLNQIIGRANRLGRIEPLNVHHLQI
jgi:hypothetical protein